MIKTRIEAGTTASVVMSLVFAVVLLVIQSGDLWVRSWRPAIGEPAPVTIRVPAYSVVRLHLGRPAEVVREHVIVQAGVPVMPDEDGRLVQAYDAMRREHLPGWSLGLFLVSLVASMLLLAELRRAPGNNQLLRAQVTLLAAVLILAGGAKAFLLITSLPSYYYPMPAVVLLAAFLFNRRIALAVNLFSSTVFASLLGFDVAILVVMFITSYAGTRFLAERRKRGNLVIAGSLSGWFGAVVLLILMLVFNGAINVSRELLFPEHSEVLAALVGGVFSGVTAVILVEPVAWLVGRVSQGKLLDLQNLEHPLLKKIHDETPGTWEHSRAAANLAEAAAAAIGADSLLARVGAYIHDAGKTRSPEFFIENQSAGGKGNPHDTLDPEVSAMHIFDHVTDGVEVLQHYHVPPAIREFAYTHHGTSILEFFWVKNKEKGNPKGLKEKAFRYPGRRPRTRETGIMMIVDAVEAASRTIKEPSKQAFENLVQRIVFTKLNQGQLDTCGLSLSDLKTVTNVLVESLVNMYHNRIEYQWQRDQAVTQTGPQGVTRTGPQTSTVDTGPVATAADLGHRPVDTGPRSSAANGGNVPVAPHLEPLAPSIEVVTPSVALLELRIEESLRSLEGSTGATGNDGGVVVRLAEPVGEPAPSDPTSSGGEDGADEIGRPGTSPGIGVRR
jgi:putative nucleotidyltransferase with HDIG domain